MTKEQLQEISIDVDRCWIMDKDLSRSIHNFPTRIKNAMIVAVRRQKERGGTEIRTLRDFVEIVSPDQLIREKNLGKKSIDEMRAFFVKLGVFWGQQTLYASQGSIDDIPQTHTHKEIALLRSQNNRLKATLAKIAELLCDLSDEGHDAAEALAVNEGKR